jgi:hypothetical protein
MRACHRSGALANHNLFALPPTPQLYNNIHVAELGALLGVAADKAEAVASRMIMERRLQVRT